MADITDDRELAARLEREVVAGPGWLGRRAGTARADAALRAVLDRHSELLRREADLRNALGVERERGEAIAAARRTLDAMDGDADEACLVALLAAAGPAARASAGLAA